MDDRWFGTPPKGSRTIRFGERGGVRALGDSVEAPEAPPDRRRGTIRARLARTRTVSDTLADHVERGGAERALVGRGARPAMTAGSIEPKRRNRNRTGRVTVDLDGFLADRRDGRGRDRVISVVTSVHAVSAVLGCLLDKTTVSHDQP
jgi:hypothetical protein